MTALTELGVTDLTAGYASGEFSPCDVLDAALDRIRSNDETYRGMYVVDDTHARPSAEAAFERWQAGTPRGPLDGVPFTVKEIIAVEGLPQSLGTAACTPREATQNAPAVDRMLEAGAVLVGSTTMPDYSAIGAGVSSRHGVGRNPWNPEWNPGGSSSGAAIATALGYGAINLGTDFGGSIRHPASSTGVFGFKPSFGRVPIIDAYVGQVTGPLTRTVADAAATMSVISAPDRRDVTCLPYQELTWGNLEFDVRGLRVGLCLGVTSDSRVDQEHVAAVTAAAGVFEDAGARVEPFARYLSRDYITEAYLTFYAAHIWALMNDPQVTSDLTLAQASVVDGVKSSQNLTGCELIAAHDDIARMNEETVRMLGTYDLVLSPVFGGVTGSAAGMTWEELEGRNFTGTYNAAGTPAASINCGFTTDGKPIGLQIAADRFEDLRVLSASAWYEERRGTHATPDWGLLPR